MRATNLFIFFVSTVGMRLPGLTGRNIGGYDQSGARFGRRLVETR